MQVRRMLTQEQHQAIMLLCAHMLPGCILWRLMLLLTATHNLNTCNYACRSGCCSALHGFALGLHSWRCSWVDMPALGCPGSSGCVDCARVLILLQLAEQFGAHACTPGLGPMTMWKISNTFC
jgi:hypothetical protein